jgi:uncharacterized protein
LRHTITIDVPNSDNIILELDDSLAPKTVTALLQNLPFTLKANIWGKEIYTDPATFSADLENPQSIVQLYDVAFWPSGSAICLFYGTTPMSKDEIKPYSPVTVIGKIIKPNISAIKNADGKKLVFHT